MGSEAQLTAEAPARPAGTMEARIHITQHVFDDLMRSLVNRSEFRESGAYLACDTLRRDGFLELYVQAVEASPDRSMTISSRHISAHPSFIAGALNFGERTNASVIVAHSHPFAAHEIQMTAFDREGEAELVPRLQRRVPGAHHGTAIFGQTGFIARCFPPQSDRPVWASVVVEPDQPPRSSRGLFGFTFARRRPTS
jgi:hypothetical protein